MAILLTINRWVIGPALPAVILTCGAFFLVRLRGFYLLHPLRLLRGMLQSSGTGGESSFRSVTLALAGTLGVGNIVGVSSAILWGGPGAVFWMWVGAFLSMSLKYAEILLAVYYRREKRENGVPVYHGGAMYYIRDGLAGRGVSPGTAGVLGGIFAGFCLLNSLTTGTMIQVNAISGSLRASLGLDPRLAGVLVLVLTAAALLAGERNITGVTVVLIPVTTLIYLVLSLYILATNAEALPRLLREIFRNAFGARSAGGGLMGVGLMQALRYGISRGIISNEAGSGTAPSAHARANARTPAQQGFWGIFEVFVDTILLCSLTAFVVLLYTERASAGADSVLLTLNAYRAGFGEAAVWLLSLCIFIFAYATVLCQFCYGRECLRYLSDGSAARLLFAAVFFGAILWGAFSESELVWQITDLAVGVMTVLNTGVLFFLRRTVISETERYFQHSKVSSRQKASKARLAGRGANTKSALISERKITSGKQS